MVLLGCGMQKQAKCCKYCRDILMKYSVVSLTMREKSSSLVVKTITAIFGKMNSLDL
jgi:hypothetical protein